MTHLARLERDALCATLVEVGPQAPTLCSPWTAADLAAHLVVRDRRPDLAPGIWLPALAARTERGMDSYAAKPWPELVDLVRSGPPVWSPARLAALDDLVNFVEFFIHHEDVLRGDEATGPRRELTERETRGVWKALSRSATLLFRRSPVGVVLKTPDGQTLTAGATDGDTVVLEGAPAELLLAAYGRRRVAAIEATGSADAIDALWSSALGIS
ncbi:TIGR03085 family metal-binding protein [Nostocoides sp. HKS02]|uniref:TIGR03085 family metal-binding protein n=1 Tax=Nostocoides sp. HKS02 TaxID=1813880 RepID=UPI0012B4B6F1|nr:TIGR03085 family metal-binding protein [Tetrasphaera sp. HKS02]QGN57122.1 TIGR03085 family protein [Tetrasphaera sp. HKS02]